MKTIVALVVTLLTAASAAAQPIRVGLASAMSGPSAITGEGVVWGATMAVEDINAKGGIMGDKVDVIVGQTHSGACIGAMPIIKELQIPQVTEACSNPKIRETSGVGGNEWQFRVNIDDAIMAN